MFKLAAIAMTGAFALTLASVARADDDVPPSPEETASIVAALEAMGCKGYDEIEKEIKKDGRHHFEVDDAICGDGEYDIDLDKDFKLMSKSRD